MSAAVGPEALARTLEELRPRLHRYCARMTGSAIDGEDALQDAIVRVLEAFPGFEALDNPEAWIFRVTHRTTLDYLRSRARRARLISEGEVASMADGRSEIDVRIAAAAGLETFMRLSVPQRSSVVLMDVLGYTLEEIATMTDSSVAAVKSSLHRGRARLRELANAPPPRRAATLGERESALLAAYADRFNARDFEAVRDMLADEVRFDVVGRTLLRGKAAVTGTYFTNYAASSDWRCVPGLAEGRPALLVGAPSDSVPPRYFILLEWRGGLVVAGRDFRHVPYVSESADLVPFTM